MSLLPLEATRRSSSFLAEDRLSDRLSHFFVTGACRTPANRAAARPVVIPSVVASAVLISLPLKVSLCPASLSERFTGRAVRGFRFFHCGGCLRCGSGCSALALVCCPFRRCGSAGAGPILNVHRRRAGCCLCNHYSCGLVPGIRHRQLCLSDVICHNRGL